MLHGPRKPANRFQFLTKLDGGLLSEGSPMRTPYGLEIIENCLVCPHREERLFCNLPDSSVRALAAIISSAAYPKGATLFVEGQPARGVFILCSGRVKLSTSSADGKTLILRIAEPGEVLGLPATVTGTSYELTADIIEPAQANFAGDGHAAAGGVPPEATRAGRRLHADPAQQSRPRSDRERLGSLQAARRGAPVLLA